ncbi:MAG: PilZ domain-containing protein [Pseudomonadota bacterium]
MNVFDTANGERRRYFRIDDDIALRYRVLEGNALDAAVERFGSDRETESLLAGTLLKSQRRAERELEHIRRDNPHVANYLEQLNHKLDVIAHLLNAQTTEMPARPTHSVNLSASGMSFNTCEALEPGSVVELKLLVFPSHTCILALGAVVNCHSVDMPRDEFIYRVGVDFSYIREIDREQLVRHVIQKQSANLRDR